MKRFRPMAPRCFIVSRFIRGNTTPLRESLRLIPKDPTLHLECTGNVLIGLAHRSLGHFSLTPPLTVDVLVPTQTHIIPRLFSHNFTTLKKATVPVTGREALSILQRATFIKATLRCNNWRCNHVESDSNWRILLILGYTCHSRLCLL